MRQRDTGWPGKLRRHHAIYVGPVHIEVDLAQQLGIALSFSSGKHSTLVRDEDMRNESNLFAAEACVDDVDVLAERANAAEAVG